MTPTRPAPPVSAAVRPPYRLPPGVTCEVCGLPAVAFWPGWYVVHRDNRCCPVRPPMPGAAT